MVMGREWCDDGKAGKIVKRELGNYGQCQEKERKCMGGCRKVRL